MRIPNSQTRSYNVLPVPPLDPLTDPYNFPFSRSQSTFSYSLSKPSIVTWALYKSPDWSTMAAKLVKAGFP